MSNSHADVRPVCGGEENSRRSTSCVNDLPASGKEADFLENIRYVNGLYDFIVRAQAPVTIGIQGGWGSGKTSLINMLKEKLSADAEDGTICVFVNAWEHSLLQTRDSKATVTLSLLSDVLKGMEEASPVDKSSLKKLGEAFATGIRAVSALAALSVGAALKAGFVGSFGKAAGNIGKTVIELPDAPLNKEDFYKEEDFSDLPSTARQVRALRKALKDIAAAVVEKSKSKRFVFFIDDLDRVPPATAVEILDVTKNIFDIPYCIFVLAVDYEVVVKGLEEKYGEKSRNEREFRQYFDKIIQIPFTMPVGSYDRQIESLLSNCFSSLEVKFNELDESTRETIQRATMAATDGVPRSVKRIVNTLSLLQCISKKQAEGEEESRLLHKDHIVVSFIIISLHINFPEICRCVMEMPKVTEWKFTDVQERWGLDQKDFDKISSNNESFAKEWEKVIYCLCRKNAWLETKITPVRDLMNSLLDALKGSEENFLEEILTVMRVVSVGETPAQPVDNVGIRADQVSVFCRDMHRGLVDKIDGLAPYEESWHATGAYGGKGAKFSKRKYSISISKANGGVNTIELSWGGKGDETFYIYCLVQGKKNFIKEINEKCSQNKIGAEQFSDNGQQWIKCFYDEGFSYEKFTTVKAEKYVAKTVMLFRKIESICAALQ